MFLCSLAFVVAIFFLVVFYWSIKMKKIVPVSEPLLGISELLFGILGRIFGGSDCTWYFLFALVVCTFCEFNLMVFFSGVTLCMISHVTSKLLQLLFVPSIIIFWT